MSLTNKKVLVPLISTIAVLLIALGALLGYRAWINSQTEEGSKEIKITVLVTKEGEEVDKEYSVKTDEEFLGDLLVNNGFVNYEGEKPQRYITAADDIVADSSNEEWWKILVNGEMAQVGMDDLAIHDGDEITIELVVGWD